ncbi:MAG TPA: gamma-glutamyltransferase, partial [Firmicutes bacterium]|nr:gamma-glutamyltransferase [Bacillota bacterium]
MSNRGFGWSISRPYPVHRGAVMATNGMVASAHPLATATGVDVLRRGGNFIDAALATAAVLNVVEPYNSNLGGDVFLIAYDAKRNETVALNGSGVAPASATIDRFRSGIPTDGLAAASVPGQVHGWLTAHKRWGTWELSELFAPAIRYAEDGFPANMQLVRAIAGVQHRIAQFPSSQRVFGTVPNPGDI